MCLKQKNLREASLAMDELVVWSWVVLFLAVVPWITYGVMLIIFSTSILFGYVTLMVHDCRWLVAMFIERISDDS